MDEDNELFLEWCRELDVDIDIALELKAKIFPLIKSGHDVLGDLFDKIFWDDIKGTEIRFLNISRLLNALSTIGFRIPNLNMNISAALALHLQILPIIESIFMNEINYLIYALMINGIDFNIPWLRRNANSLEEIERAGLSLKLKHLRNNNYNIIANNIDTDIRNSIAHMFYEIAENGEVYVGGIKKDIEKDYKMVRNIAYSIHLVKKLYYRRFAFA